MSKRRITQQDTLYKNWNSVLVLFFVLIHRNPWTATIYTYPRRNLMVSCWFYRLGLDVQIKGEHRTPVRNTELLRGTACSPGRAHQIQRPGPTCTGLAHNVAPSAEQALSTLQLTAPRCLSPFSSHPTLNWLPKRREQTVLALTLESPITHIIHQILKPPVLQQKLPQGKSCFHFDGLLMRQFIRNKEPATITSGLGRKTRLMEKEVIQFPLSTIPKK